MSQYISPQLQSLITELAQVCLKHSITISTAESCTGGGVAYSLTSLPGSSQWFDRGFVTYSNSAKIDMLGVAREIIDCRGAVSEEVVRQMAEGALRHSLADVALAITGVAGPEGGSLLKPVGTCWLGWAGAKFITQASQKIFVGDRESVRTQAIVMSIKKMLQLVKSNY